MRLLFPSLLLPWLLLVPAAAFAIAGFLVGDILMTKMGLAPRKSSTVRVIPLESAAPDSEPLSRREPWGSASAHILMQTWEDRPSLG